MYNNNTINEGFKQLSPEARQDEKQVQAYNELVENVLMDECYIDFPDKDFFEYFENVKSEYLKRNDLNEDTQYANWYSTSPFYCLSGISKIRLGGLGKIFAPLKWLAGLLLAGTGLLLAAILKALHEGKKQLAIYKVRKWLERLVIIADGGYKKTKKSKDSLFLIEARARRDILQAAVMLGEAAGLDIPEKTTEALNPIETAANESLQFNQWLELYETNNANYNGVANGNFNNQGTNQPYNPIYQPSHSTPNSNNQNQTQTQSTSNNNSNAQNYVKYKANGKEYQSFDDLKQGLSERGIGPANAQIEGTRDGQTWETIKNEDVFSNEELRDMNQEASSGKFLEEDIKSITWVQPRQNGGAGNNIEYPYTDDGLKKFISDLEKSSLYNIKTMKVEAPFRMIVELNNGKQMPVNGQNVILNHIQARLRNLNLISEKEFNKNINLSYGSKPKLPDDSRVDWSLMTTLKTSRAWFSFLSFFRKKYRQNFWGEAKSVGKIKLTQIKSETDRQHYITQVINNCNVVLNRILTPGIAQAYCNTLNQYIQNVMGRDNDSNKVNRNALGGTQRSYKFGSGTNESYNGHRSDDRVTIDLTPEEYLAFRTGNQSVKFDINVERNLVDNTFQLMQNIITQANPSEFKIRIKTREQMERFLVELTKTVHVIIDNVAKKVKENVGNNANSSLVSTLLTFISNNDADPKQNRTLHNIWDNYGRNYLDSRAETRCDELISTPEYTYFMEMLNKVVPICVTSTFVPNNKNGENFMALVDETGVKMTNDAINKLKGKKPTKQKTQQVNDADPQNALDMQQTT